MRSSSVFVGHSLALVIPQDHERGSRKARVVRAIRWLWSKGLYPTPTVLNARLHGRVSNNLNGFDSQVRKEVMEELGIPYLRSAPDMGRGFPTCRPA